MKKVIGYVLKKGNEFLGKYCKTTQGYYTLWKVEGHYSKMTGEFLQDLEATAIKINQYSEDYIKLENGGIISRYGKNCVKYDYLNSEKMHYDGILTTIENY